jgi:hypothetical protein
MPNRKLYSFLASAALSIGVLPAQEKTVLPDGVPSARGVYFRTSSGWMALQATILMPFTQGAVREFLGLGGGRSAIAEFPGPRAMMQTTSTRPTFYVRGFSPAARLYLIRGTITPDHRELRMRVSHRVADGPQFLADDLRDIDVQAVDEDLVSITPRSELTPGEYAIVSVLDRSYRWIHIGFEFGVAGSGRSE